MGRAVLVDDEPDRVRPAASRSRAERDSLPEDFSTQYPTRGTEAPGNLRTRRRAPVRKGVLPAWAKSRWGRIVLICSLVFIPVVLAAAAFAVRSFFEHDPRFRIQTSDSIQTTGNSQLSRNQLLSVFGADIGRNIFFVPLAQRRTQLEQIPWVEHATVMRILPNQLRVVVQERTPIAFVRVGSQIKLIDAAGVILDMPPAVMAARHYSFPVVTGLNASDPLSTRAARMQLYQKFVTALDSTGKQISVGVSEVNLSDPEDLRATLPVKSSDLLLHFGDSNFLARYQIFQSHLSAWEQQYPRLASVDLRYDSEVVLKMAPDTTAAPAKGAAAASPANAKAAPAKTKAAPPAKAKTAPRAKAKARAKTRHTTTKHSRAAKRHAGRSRR